MKPLISVLASGALLTILYRSLDVRQVGEALLQSDRLWLVISVGMILPITVLRAVRFFWVAPAGALPGIGEALRLTVVASAVNVFVPAKAGDLVKSYFLAKRSDTTAGVSVAIVVYERLCDLLALISWCLVGVVVGRPRVPGLPSLFWPLLGLLGVVCAVLVLSERGASRVHSVITRALPQRRLRKLRELSAAWPDLLRLLRPRRHWIVLFSLALWLVHLFQIWLFTVTLSAPIPFTVSASLAALALMAGQMPFTIAGLGARDVALVVLLSGYMAPESAAAMGILIASRTLVPPLMGLPIMGSYLSSIGGDVRRWRREMGTAR